LNGLECNGIFSGKHVKFEEINMANKVFLALIALGLWANVFSLWVRPASGEGEEIVRRAELEVVRADVEAIARGTGAECRNPKICLQPSRP
jgi:hypothetical protein